MINFVAAGGEPAVGSGAEEIVVRLLYQLILIFVATRIVVWFSKRLLGQTEVAGEILAGLLLGPSLLGLFAPDFLSTIFHPETSAIFVGIAQVGLILLMFQIGLEFEFNANVGRSRHTVAVISICGIILPFVLGYLTAPWFWNQMSEPRPQEFGFRLFFAIAMSITAIPVLGRIFIELGLTHTRTAALTIASAAVDDVVGWLLLGVIAAVITSQFQLDSFLMRLAGLALYLSFVFFVAGKWIQSRIRSHMDRFGKLENHAIAWLIIVILISGAITSNLGVFAIIGGFVIGIALHTDRRFVEEWNRRVSPLVTTFFLPVFFAYTGLRTDIGTLNSADALFQCILVIAIAFAGKLGGAYFASRFLGESHRSAMTIGISMNTRGLMELITLNIGYDLGVLPKPMFTMLVIMALTSTYLATPLIRRFMAKEIAAETNVIAE